MKNIYQIIHKIICFSLPIVALLSMIELSAQSGDYFVVANTSVPVDNMTKKELKSSLNGKKTRWSDKSKIVLGLMKADTELGKRMAEDILGLSATQMNKHYLTMVFQGKISAPKFFTSESELVQFISSTKGAIGIASKPLTRGGKTITINN